MEFLTIAGLAGIVCGGGCAIIASNKKRDPHGWFVLGFFFNLVALIVVAVLTPSEAVAAGNSADRAGRSDDPLHREDLRKKAANIAASLAESKAKLTG